MHWRRYCEPRHPWHTAANKWASGSGRYRRPSTQPATTVWASVEECGVRSRQELENKVWAGSEALNVTRHCPRPRQDRARSLRWRKAMLPVHVRKTTFVCGICVMGRDTAGVSGLPDERQCSTITS